LAYLGVNILKEISDDGVSDGSVRVHHKLDTEKNRGPMLRFKKKIFLPIFLQKCECKTWIITLIFEK
jgi:hypothetical protein